LEPESLIAFVAKFEFLVITAAFGFATCLLSIKAALIIVAAVLTHTFPKWEGLIREFIDRHNRGGKS
jgi:hypothetical protein